MLEFKARYVSYFSRSAIQNILNILIPPYQSSAACSNPR